MLELLKSVTGSTNVFARLGDVEFLRRKKTPRTLTLYTEVHGPVQLAILRIVGRLIQGFRLLAKTEEAFEERFDTVEDLDLEGEGDSIADQAARTWEGLFEESTNGSTLTLTVPQSPPDAPEHPVRDETAFMKLLEGRPIAYNFAVRDSFADYQKQWPEARTAVVVNGPVWLFGEHGELLGTSMTMGKDGGFTIGELAILCRKAGIVAGVHEPSKWVGSEIEYCRETHRQTHTYVKVHFGAMTTFWCFGGSYGGFLGVLLEEQPTDYQRMWTMLTKQKEWPREMSNGDPRFEGIKSQWSAARYGLQDHNTVFVFDENKAYLGAMRA